LALADYLAMTATDRQINRFAFAYGSPNQSIKPTNFQKQFLSKSSEFAGHLRDHRAATDGSFRGCYRRQTSSLPPEQMSPIDCERNREQFITN
jgi:hypothetical protein